MFLRQQILSDSETESLFLWGARQTGKSTLLKSLFPDSMYFDLLKNDEFERLQRNPSQLREILTAVEPSGPVIIDEIQKLPALLDEIHWLITNTGARFILSGSSPRKLIRSQVNLLGGRALRYELYPLVSSEIPDFNLLRALNNGLIPKHYLSAHPQKLLSSYTGSYLRDEILGEARIRNINSFSRFLEVAAITNGEMVNYSNIAADCGVSSPTIKEYFQILEDTLIGRFLPSFQKKPKRRVILAPKFYYFDVGIANYLLKRKNIEKGNEVFGKAFEHFIYQEIYANSSYSGINYPIHYWRTASQLEIDFVLGDGEVAIEVKATENANARHIKGLLSFAEDYKAKKLILVSNDPYPRMLDGVLILPWKDFLNKLWNQEIIS
ncbi:MAG: AAA family ATPase [Bacteroidetes bacterium HGW-Bacteroidetes-21]|jgi:predicted AAA+ superfamily ATPase|nr:MAG: AAA family ATPase [Bacteroidetes bacterium HGW-Bacteroidetes-21]